MQGWAYWKSYWSWIEWFIIGTSVSAVGFYFYKTFVTNKLLDIFSKTFGNGYMKLQHVALVDEFYGYHLGLLIFFANIKLLKILKFNHKMSLLIYTLARCWGDLSGFLGIFFMAFGAFVQMFYLILYCELDDFKTLVRTFETCFTMMLNKFKFGKLKETSTVAAVMFFFFAVCVNWILVNVLLTIILLQCFAVGSRNALHHGRLLRACAREFTNPTSNALWIHLGAKRMFSSFE